MTVEQVATQTVTSQTCPIKSLPSGSSVREVDTSEVLDNLFCLLTRVKVRLVPDLSPLPWLVIDCASVQPTFEARNETFWVEESLVQRISRIVGALMDRSPVLRQVDKAKTMESLSGLLETLPAGQLASVSDSELTERIEKIMLVEAVSGLLNELSPAERECFDVAATRRQLFR